MENRYNLQWVRAPHQTRSRRTMDRILDAAEGLLLERGAENVPVAEIARRAGASVGAIYARFRDKNSLLQCLHERFSEDAIATSDAALEPVRWQGASAGEIISALTAFMVRVYSERAGLLQAFFALGQNDPHFQDRNRRISENFLSRLHALLEPRFEEIGHPDPGRGISFGLAMVLGVLKNTFILCEGVSEPACLALEDLEAELIRAYGAYLGLDPSTYHQNQKGNRTRMAG